MSSPSLPTSFLQNYMLWCSGTEVPRNYQYWSGISAVSAALASRVWTRMGRFPIYPNLYIIFLGPPGNGKTVAKDQALKIVRELPEIKLSAEAQTKEGLVRYMRDECQQTYTWNGAAVPCTPISLYLTELSQFLGANSSHMLDFLTTIWDRTGDVYDSRTKNKGDDILPSPYVNLLACTTPDWISTYLKSDIITGGFTRRAIFVNEPANDDMQRVPRPEWTAEQLAAKASAIEYARRLATTVGEMTWTPDATQWWDNWYTTRHIPKDPDIRGYHKSKPGLLLKVATVVALAERIEMTITSSHMITALALLDSTETTLSRVFQGIGRNQLNGVASKLMEYVYNSPKAQVKLPDGREVTTNVILEKTLRSMSYRDAAGREFDDIMSHLLATDKILKVFTAENPPRALIVLK